MRTLLILVLLSIAAAGQDRYIVVLNEEAPRVGRVKHEYRSLRGYASDLTAAEAESLRRDPRVKYVEPDSIVFTQTVQQNATWGIARLSHRFYQYPLSTDYFYNATGAGVNVYVIDTGILLTHPDFEGRAVKGYGTNNIAGCNGHGTHVAGTVGSATYGVAKQVSLVSVRVFPCSGSATVSDVIKGVDWVNRQKKVTSPPMVANMSLSTGRSQALEDAVQAGLDKGIVYVVAAGNYANNACNYSPAHLAGAITVGSLTQTDSRDPSTNYGRCVDLFAPGVLITSTWNTPDMPVRTISGTSMASPHVAGAAALYLETHPLATPAEVQAAIIANATPDVVYNAGEGSPNLLAHSIF